MKLIDKIALNRLIGTIANFILSLVKIFAPKAVEDIEVPVKPDRRKIFPIFRKKKQNEDPK